jgi:selenoprotein W-related protein
MSFAAFLILCDQCRLLVFRANEDMKPTIEIEYCPKCGWLLRAAWMAQELLTTFTDDLHAVQLKPSEVAGRYLITIGGELLWDRKREGHFPEAKEIKQRVRDIIAPDRDLGHSDR